MDTHPDRRPTLLVTVNPATTSDSNLTAATGGWRAAGFRCRAALSRLRPPAWIRQAWPAVVIVLIVAPVLALLVKLVWLIARALGAGIGNAGDGLHRLGGWIARGPITHSINDPVRAWLDGHTTGLPATGHDLWITWLVTAAVLYAFAVAGSRYARIGWGVTGALTAAAAYAGAGPAGPTAAAVTIAVWLLLSLLAYTRTGGSVIEQIIRDMGRRRDAQLRIAELQAETDARAEAREARRHTDPDLDPGPGQVSHIVI